MLIIPVWKKVKKKKKEFIISFFFRCVFSSMLRFLRCQYDLYHSLFFLYLLFAVSIKYSCILCLAFSDFQLLIINFRHFLSVFQLFWKWKFWEMFCTGVACFWLDMHFPILFNSLPASLSLYLSSLFSPF